MDAEVRKLIDTLACHAAASSTGAESFIEFVRSNQRGNPAFAFLSDPTHPHHSAWIDTLAQEQAKHGERKSLHVDADDREPVAIPARLIPAVVEDMRRWSDPYTPADGTSIEIASNSVREVEMDEYLSMRLKCFEEDLEYFESRPGVSYGDALVELGVPIGVSGKKQDRIPVVNTIHLSDGGYRGGGKVKGLGFDRSKAGQTEAALEGYRSMKKLGQGYGKIPGKK